MSLQAACNGGIIKYVSLSIWNVASGFYIVLFCNDNINNAYHNEHSCLFLINIKTESFFLFVAAVMSQA